MRRFLFATALLCAVVPAFAQMRIIPHLTRPDGSFATEILVQNTAPITVEFLMTGYNDDGTGENTIRVTLGPFEGLRGSSSDFFGADLSHFFIDGPPMIKTSVDYIANTAGAAPANVGEKGCEYTWNFYGGDWTTTFDALAIINADDSGPAQVIVNQWDELGAFIASTELETNLAPWAKTLFVMSTVFTVQPNTYFEIVSNRKLSVIGLRGNLDSTFLWENNLIPVTWYQWSLTEDLLGIWALTYSDGPTFERAYNLSSISPDFDEAANKFIFGTNAEGEENAIGFYFTDTTQAYAIFEQSPTGGTDDLYLFDLDGDTVAEGCHFNAFSDGSFSECHPLTGGRTIFSANKTNRRASPPRKARLDGSKPINALDPAPFATILREALAERKQATAELKQQ